MREQRLSDREWGTSSQGFDDGTSGASPTDPSDFSPVFWLASAPRGILRPIRKRLLIAADHPLNYPVLVGIILICAVLIQRNVVSLN